MKQISYSGGEGVMEHKFLVMKGTDILVYISSHQGESEDHSEKQHLMLLTLWVRRGRFSSSNPKF